MKAQMFKEIGVALKLVAFPDFAPVPVEVVLDVKLPASPRCSSAAC